MGKNPTVLDTVNTEQEPSPPKTPPLNYKTADKQIQAQGQTAGNS